MYKTEIKRKVKKEELFENIAENGNGDILRSIYSFLDEKNFVLNATGEYSIQVYLFGCYGYALTFLMLVTAVTQAFGQSAMPALTSAWTVKDKTLIKKNINTILKVTLLVTLPAGIGLSVLAQPLLTLLFGVRDEVIIATNSSVEGEATAVYISKLIKPTGIKVSRIASGVPVGGDLECIDEMTLLRALEGRIEL